MNTKLHILYKKMLEEYGGPGPITQFGAMGAQSADAGNGGGAFGTYPIDTGEPLPDKQPGYGNETYDPTDASDQDARMPTGLYAIKGDKKKKFEKREDLDKFLKDNPDWKLLKK